MNVSNNHLAPVILFVYNRPDHTQQTLEALSENDLAENSVLYVYCDGPKEHTTPENLSNIEATRKLVAEHSWPGEKHIVERTENIGLAESVIAGVTEIVDRYGKVIVLEDDLISSPKFLEYMNYGLMRFESEERVASINASWIHERIAPILPNYYFLESCDCWGWGTWKESWKIFEKDASKLLASVSSDPTIARKFEPEWMDILKAQVAGSVSSWHIRWLSSCIIHNKIGLFTKKSYIANIGLDGSGTHSHTDLHYELSDLNLKLDKEYIDTMKIRPRTYVEVLVKRYRSLHRIKSKVIDKLNRQKS